MNISVLGSSILLQGEFQVSDLTDKNFAFIEELQKSQDYQLYCDEVSAVNSFFILWLLEIFRQALAREFSVNLAKKQSDDLLRLVSLYRLDDILTRSAI